MKPTRRTQFFGTFISNSLHVSGNYVRIIRRTYCSMRHWYFSLCMGGCLQLLYMFRATMCPSSGIFHSVWVAACNFYMFRETMCPSSGELTVSMRHWYFSFCMGGCLQLLYMFRATLCPSSEELTVSMRHWYFSLCGRTDTVNSPCELKIPAYRPTV